MGGARRTSRISVQKRVPGLPGREDSTELGIKSLKLILMKVYNNSDYDGNENVNTTYHYKATIYVAGCC